MKVLFIPILTFFISSALKELKTTKGPIHIKAERMRAYQKERKIIFEGNVVLKQEDLILYGDMAEVYVDKNFEKIEKIIGVGNIRVIKGEKNATCGRLEFDAEKRILKMRDRPSIWSKTGIIKGEIIKFYVDKEMIEVEKAISVVKPAE